MACTDGTNRKNIRGPALADAGPFYWSDGAGMVARAGFTPDSCGFNSRRLHHYGADAKLVWQASLKRSLVYWPTPGFDSLSLRLSTLTC